MVQLHVQLKKKCSQDISIYTNEHFLSEYLITLFLCISGLVIFEWFTPKFENILSMDAEIYFKQSLECPFGASNLPTAVHHVKGLPFLPDSLK